MTVNLTPVFTFRVSSRRIKKIYKYINLKLHKINKLAHKYLNKNRFEKKKQHSLKGKKPIIDKLKPSH